MPINHPTLALAKNHAERLHNGGGKDYGGGHGIIVDGEKIKIDTTIVAEISDIEKVQAEIENNQHDIELLNTNLGYTNKDLNTTTQSLSDYKHTNNQEIANLKVKDNNLQTQIDNLENGTTAIPVATAGKPGIVMPRRGLAIDSSGALNTTIQEYGDLGCGKVFLDHNQSKVVKLYYPCNSIYFEFHLVDTTGIAGSNLLFMNTSSTSETITRGYLTASFNKDGLSFTVTNNHSTNAMFIDYGCADII